MKRRALLVAVGTSGVGLPGCLRGSTTDPADAEWTHDVGGRVDSVADGRVFFRENFQDDAGDGSLTALDATTGEHRWSYGSSNGLSSFPDPTVEDAVYVGNGDDGVGSGSGELYAVEFDGAKRWTFDTGSVYERPRLHEGSVYVGSDDGVVRAIDADAGDDRWRYEVAVDEEDGSPDPSVEAVDGNAVYVVAGGLIALDPTTGDRLWQFGDGDASVSSADVHDGVVYVRDGYSVRAIENGEASWDADPGFESPPRVAVDDGRIFVRAGTGLLGFDAADGSKRWTVDVDHLSAWTVHSGRVYAAGTELYAFGAEDGAEYWSESVAEGLLVRVQVVDSGEAGGGIPTGGSAPNGADHAVFVEQKDAAIHRVSAAGEVIWRQDVPGNVRSFLVDRQVYVGTDEEVYAFDPE